MGGRHDGEAAELDPSLREGFFPSFAASDPDDLAVLLCAALNAAGVEHHVVVKLEGKVISAIEVRRGKREGNFGGVGSLIASLPVGPVGLGLEEAHGLLLAEAIEAAGKL